MTKAIILLPLMMLAACDSGPSVTATNASVEEVATKVEAARQDKDFLLPGKWLTKASIEELSAPGMPAGIAEKMKQMGDSKPGTESCMTEADARKPNADFFSGNKNCRYDHFKMGGGKIDAKMRCTAGGGVQRMTMNGEYSPESYRMAMQTEIDRGASSAAAGAMGSITMKMRVEGKRIGECDVSTINQPAAQ